jgi:hypothetical protein
MVSVVDDLVARELIVMREARWELRAVLAEVEVNVPESLCQMIERRMDQLEEDERRVLTVGSVAGMEFSAASVAAVLQRAPSEELHLRTEARMMRCHSWASAESGITRSVDPPSPAPIAGWSARGPSRS